MLDEMSLHKSCVLVKGCYEFLLKLFSQLAHVTNRKWNYELIWTNHFCYTTHDLPHEQVVIHHFQSVNLQKVFKGMIITLKELFNLFYQLFWPIGYLSMYLTQYLSQEFVSTIIISYHVVWRWYISVHDRVGVVHIDTLEFGRRYLMHFGYMHISFDSACISYNQGC